MSALGSRPLRLRAVWLALVLVGVGMGSAAPAEARTSRRRVTFLGWAREISRAQSASRDAPAFALGIAPRHHRTAAGELAFLTVRTCPVTLRTGFYGLLDLENEGRTEGFESLFPDATGNLLWRGSYAWYAALSLDSLARRICRRCGLEGAVAFRHESEHYTGSNSGDPGTDYSDRPHIGDLFSLDAAIRWADGDWVLVGRLQNAFFVPDRSGYSFGPAIDLHARFQPWERLHFFFSGYAENLFGAEVEGRTYPDAYLLRGLLGLALPSDLGDVMLYLSADVGHRRGIAIFTEEATVGVGVRLALGPVED